MKSTGTRALAVALAAVVVLPAPAFATNGYFSHGVGLKAKGMGGVGLAYPLDALAAGTNPAGMALVGDRLDAGVDLFRPDRGTEISGNANEPVNMVYDANREQSFFMPEFGLNRTLGDKLSLGLSVYGNGGMNTSYTTPIGLFGTTNAGVDLAQMFIVPSVAVRLGDSNSLGLGVNVVWQRFKADGLENFDNEMMSSNPGKVTGNDYDSSTGFGVRVGWMGRFGDLLTVGASYQSRTYMGEFEEYSGLFAESGGFDIPSNYGVGVALEPVDRPVLAADVTQILYSEVASIANPLLPNLGEAQLGTDGGAGFGWEADLTMSQDSFGLGVGVLFWRFFWQGGTRSRRKPSVPLAFARAARPTGALRLDTSSRRMIVFAHPLTCGAS